MDLPKLNESSHRRFNILNRTWILVSPQRTKRPWQGKEESVKGQDLPEHDPGCYLCPGNGRAGGKKNPRYTGTFVFDNDFPALVSDTPEMEVDASGLFVAGSEKGVCRVVCFSPRHDMALARMDEVEIAGVVGVWSEQYQKLAVRNFVNAVTIFENRGDIMGCSNPHPHGQIWATQSVPEELRREVDSFAGYSGGKCILCDYLNEELKRETRIVCENEHFVCLVPFWAFWPYETLIFPRNHVRNISELGNERESALAAIIKSLGVRYDNLFKISFPYSMGIHQRGLENSDNEPFHFHLHYYPPLLRSATIKKFRVGFEMLGEPQRDITAEGAAEVLRGLSEVHYSEVE